MESSGKQRRSDESDEEFQECEDKQTIIDSSGNLQGVLYKYKNFIQRFSKKYCTL